MSNHRYLQFLLGEEVYALPITKVHQIIQYETITSVRDSMDYLIGVINLRGKVVPIIDMRKKFKMEQKDFNDRTIFVIVETNINGEESLIGLAVDAVSDVIVVDKDNIDRPPEVGMRLKGSYLSGVAKISDKMIFILDIDKILSSEDILNINEHVS